MEKIFYHLRRNYSLYFLSGLALVSVFACNLKRIPRSYTHTVYSHSAHIKKPSPFIPEFFKHWRARFLNTAGKNDHLGLVRGIFLGEDSSIPDDVREKFKDAGLTHLLAASGFNCWIVAYAFALLGRLVLFLLEPHLPSTFSLRGRRYGGPVSAIFGAWLFWLWSDQSSPITRSAVLISTRFLLTLLEFKAPFLRVLLIQYLCSLIIFPTLWFNASFQMTFGCLFGIQAMPVSKSRVATYLLSSFGACLGAIPTTWIVFGEINFTGILTNWFTVPLVSFLIMPLGLLQMFCSIPGVSFGPGLLNALGAINEGLTQILYLAVTVSMEILPSLRYSD